MQRDSAKAREEMIAIQIIRAISTLFDGLAKLYKTKRVLFWVAVACTVVFPLLTLVAWNSGISRSSKAAFAVLGATGTAVPYVAYTMYDYIGTRLIEKKLQATFGKLIFD